MHTCLRVLPLVFSIMVVLTVDTAYPNGRTSPHSKDISVVKATCTDRSDGERHVVSRTQITGVEGSSQMLSVLTKGVREELSLADIKRLTLPTAQVNGEGFMKATVVRRDGTEEREALVQVKSGPSKFHLEGFKGDGIKTSIDLSTCKELEFSSAAGAGNSKNQPVMKK
jgi:hypothetical protein